MARPKTTDDEVNAMSDIKLIRAEGRKITVEMDQHHASVFLTAVMTAIEHYPALDQEIVGYSSEELMQVYQDWYNVLASIED